MYFYWVVHFLHEPKGKKSIKENQCSKGTIDYQHVGIFIGRFISYTYTKVKKHKRKTNRVKEPHTICM